MTARTNAAGGRRFAPVSSLVSLPGLRPRLFSGAA